MQPELIAPIPPDMVATGIPIGLALYLVAWVLMAAITVWTVVRVLKARENDGTPTLFFYLRQMPKQESLMVTGVILVFGTAIPTLWRLAFGLTMGPAFSEWLLFVAGLLAINGATYVGKRATFKPGADVTDETPEAVG